METTTLFRVQGLALEGQGDSIIMEKKEATALFRVQGLGLEGQGLVSRLRAPRSYISQNCPRC